MKTISRYIMTLVLLVTAASSAWAQAPTVYTSEVDMSVLKVGDILAQGFSLKAERDNKVTLNANRYRISDAPATSDTDLYKDGITVGTNCVLTYNSVDYIPVNEDGKDGNVWVITKITKNYSYIDINISGSGIMVTPVTGKTNEWEFAMPASDVVLTPIYAAATIYQNDGVTEKQAYESFKEAFLAAQDGDVIKLDWDVTVTSKTDLMTGKRATADPVKFTIDFNGYILDGSSAGGTFINTEHEGDEITFIDSSVDQTGGLKGMVSGVDNSFVFSSGRYNFNDGTAADIESLWTTLLVPNGWAMADGKEFVDIENAPDANGFMVRVDYKAIELTIDAGRFETFYSDQNITLADGTPAGIELYTIKSINADLSTATLSDPLTDIIVAGTPILVYNGTADEQTVTIKVTTEQPFNALMWAGAFQGTAVDKEFTEDDMEDYDYYALSGGKAFVKVRGAGILGAHQCYLEIPKQQSAGSKARGITIVFDDDEATRINEVIEVNGVNDDTWYDLSGRRVTKPTKGVFIKNGKKVVK